MSFRLRWLFVIFGLILALIFSHARPTPAYAWDKWEAGWNDLKSWADNFWSNVHCTTDVHCWIEKVGDSGASYVIRVAAGTDIQKIRQAKDLGGAFDSGYGLVGATGGLIGGVYENPANIHFATFFQDKLANNLLTSPAYATAGTDILAPIYENAWKPFRDVAYALFVVIVGAIALMIVLRRQIDPRTVVTVTNALPKILIALILITLSYPIAALFIDILAFWLPAVINKVFDFQGLLDALLEGMVTTVEAAITGSLGYLFSASAGAIVLALVVLAVSTAGAGLGAAAIAGLFLIAIVVVFALIVLGAVLLQLLYRYARLLILTALGPLILLFGALPGQEGVTTGWFKDLAANALAFPVILFAFYLAVTILQAGEAAQLSSAALQKIPGLGGPAGILGGLVVPLSSLMVLLFALRAPGMIEKIIKGRR